MTYHGMKINKPGYSKYHTGIPLNISPNIIPEEKKRYHKKIGYYQVNIEDTSTKQKHNIVSSDYSQAVMHYITICKLYCTQLINDEKKLRPLSVSIDPIELHPKLQ